MTCSAETVLLTLPKEIQHNPTKVMEHARKIGEACLGLKETSVSRERDTIEFLDGSCLRPSGKRDGKLPEIVWIAVHTNPSRPRIRPEIWEKTRIKQG